MATRKLFYVVCMFVCLCSSCIVWLVRATSEHLNNELVINNMYNSKVSNNTNSNKATATKSRACEFYLGGAQFDSRLEHRLCRLVFRGFC